MKSSSALTTRSASGQNSEIHVWPRIALYDRFLALTMVTMVNMTMRWDDKAICVILNAKSLPVAVYEASLHNISKNICFCLYWPHCMFIIGYPCNWTHIAWQCTDVCSYQEQIASLQVFQEQSLFPKFLGWDPAFLDGPGQYALTPLSRPDMRIYFSQIIRNQAHPSFMTIHRFDDICCFQVD